MKKILLTSLLLLALAATQTLTAQSRLTENTLKLDSTSNMPPARIEDLAWMAGRWIGEGFGGQLEETWNPPLGGAMVATFRMLSNNQPSFYEICLIAPEGNSLMYKVKHFNPDFSAWEEKTEMVRFPLIKMEPGKVWFEGLTLVLEGDVCTQYLAMKQKSGSYREVKLTFHRAVSKPEPNPELAAFQSKIKPTPVMFLGTYHMSNPGMDAFNLQSDDVLAPKRQAEMATFQPTIIAIEAPFNDSLTLARFQEYLTGELSLRKNETEQIGFRLAKILGHQKIYPIDVTSNLEMGDMQQVIAADPARHGARMAEVQELGNGAIALMGKWLKEGSVMNMLYQMNRPEFHDLNYELYLRISLPTVQGDNYAGADFVGQWHHRNLKIMSNLHQIGFTPEDRILVVFGQGHVPLFQRIAEDSPWFKVVDVLPYLKAD